MSIRWKAEVSLSANSPLTASLMASLRDSAHNVVVLQIALFAVTGKPHKKDWCACYRFTQMKLWHHWSWIADSVLFTGWEQCCSHHLHCCHYFLWWSQMLKSKIHSRSGAQPKAKIEEMFAIYKNKEKLKHHINNSIQTVLHLHRDCDQTEVADILRHQALSGALLPPQAHQSMSMSMSSFQSTRLDLVYHRQSDATQSTS